MSTDVIPCPAPAVLPAALFAPTPKAARRVLEFFTTQINNDHARKAYLNATRRFAQWCDAHGIAEPPSSAFTSLSRRRFRQGAAGFSFSPPTVKQHLTAIRMLFDWMVTGGVLAVNPASAVRGAKYVIKKGKTPVLTPEKARMLLDSIDVEENSGPRDRALLTVMVYSFARVSAVVGMTVGDYYQQGKRWLMRLHEKGGEHHELPVHHKAEEYLHAYLKAAGIADQKGAPLPAGGTRRGRQLPHLPGHRNYSLSAEWRHSRARAGDRRA
jgi:site-specific recombinase XerC